MLIIIISSSTHWYTVLALNVRHEHKIIVFIYN